MLTKRIVVCLDVSGGRVMKGTRFVALRDVGEPAALATRYEDDGADEIVFLDISASVEDRRALLDVARRTAERLFIPLTIGGGIRTADDAGDALRAGADKVSFNSAAVARPAVLSESAARFGAQAVVASIDAKRRDVGGWEVWVRGGRQATGLDAVEWAERCVSLGAGEILLTSIDRDGERCGYDLELTAAVSAAVPVPVVASGGAGAADHLAAAFIQGGADAALVAGILHDGVTTVGALKDHLSELGIPVRSVQ
jgi:imidazole glycerol-phosphate synthase subunit HisF